uniref:Plexin domain-containing protein 2 n=1 Tax=Timema monikensis TaxID=170555 RepID=A0A7R9HJH9_9NEOP|nr:unnamed protein product [Timema monikensis]
MWSKALLLQVAIDYIADDGKIGDHHQYYNSSFLVSQAVGEMYWVNMTNRNDVHVNDMLSTSYRRAVTVKLSFDFPFYGHLVRNITVATGGFLYTGEYVHSWLAATQYIAPLMANFDTRTSFTVEWEKVKLQDDSTSGDFTFQVTLHNNGDIVFVYQNVPVIIENILDRHHPVKVGLSDAYIIDRTIFFVRHKTIYEYHRVNFEKQDIKNWTVIYISALRTCLDEKNCSDCLTQFSSFKCYWCPHANRCSNGLDRLRQDWLTRGCDTSALDTSEQCPAIEEINKSVNAGHTRSPQHVIVNDRTKSGHIPGILAITIILAVCGALGLWIMYAYRNPHTASGQFLIRNRPSMWRWRRGEARYTAATIHM